MTKICTSSNPKQDAVNEELAELRATNARLTGALEQTQRSSNVDNFDHTRSSKPELMERFAELRLDAEDALSSDAFQDLVCIREVIRILDGITKKHPDDCEHIHGAWPALAALRERFGDGK